MSEVIIFSCSFECFIYGHGVLYDTGVCDPGSYVPEPCKSRPKSQSVLYHSE